MASHIKGYHIFWCKKDDVGLAFMASRPRKQSWPVLKQMPMDKPDRDSKSMAEERCRRAWAKIDCSQSIDNEMCDVSR